MGFMDYLSDLYASMTVQVAEAEEQQQQQDDSSGRFDGVGTRSLPTLVVWHMVEALRAVCITGELTRDVL